jgi:hypothetical protein
MPFGVEAPELHYFWNQTRPPDAYYTPWVQVLITRERCGEILMRCPLPLPPPQANVVPRALDWKCAWAVS